MKVLEGKVVSEGAKIGIVAARFNEFIVSKLMPEQGMVWFVTMVRMMILHWHGCREHLRFRSWQRRWQNPVNMMP